MPPMVQRQAEPFLVRRSLTRSILRRQSSSRVIQRCWRAFKAKSGTTRALARQFNATGVPATGKVQSSLLGMCLHGPLGSSFISPKFRMFEAPWRLPYIVIRAQNLKN